MSTTDLGAVKDLYEQNLKQHGVSSQAVGWRDADSQMLRFEQLSKMIDPPSAPFTMADLGCGYGAYYTWLRDNGYNVTEFFGYDISAEMLNVAREQVTDAGTHFIESDHVETTADYVTTSGIFNVRFNKSDEEWTRFICATLDNMFAQCRKGIAFNVLSSYVDWKEDHLYYADPAFFFDYCKKNHSRFVTLLHDYPLWEWTIFVRKP